MAAAATRNQAETSTVTPEATDDSLLNSANLYSSSVLFMVLAPLSSWLRSLPPRITFICLMRGSAWNMDRSLGGPGPPRKAKATKCGKGGVKCPEGGKWASLGRMAYLSRHVVGAGRQGKGVAAQRLVPGFPRGGCPATTKTAPRRDASRGKTPVARILIG